MWWTLGLVLLAGCGRIGFDPADDSGGTPTWPNLPATCTIQTDTTLDELPPSGWEMAGGVELVADPSAPSGAPMVTQFTYDAGFTGGVAPGGVSFPPPPDVRELYVGLVWKASNPWQGHATGFNTLFYIEQDNGTSLTSGTYGLDGSAPPYDIVTTYDGTVLPADASTTVTLAAWHTAEVHWIPSTSTIDWYFDGRQLGHASQPIADLQFAAFALLPIWGGAGDMKNETDHIWMDRAIVCAR